MTGESTFLYPSINHLETVLNICLDVSRPDQQRADGFAYFRKRRFGYRVPCDHHVRVFAADVGDKTREILVYPSFCQISYDAFAYFFTYAHADFDTFSGYELEYEKRMSVRLTLAINVAETCVFFESVGSLHYAEITALPFLLRRESTFLPPLVDIL